MTTLAEPPEGLWGKIKAGLEVWRPIEGFEAYEVSSMGRIRRRLKGGHNTVVGKILPPRPVTNGYFQVQLFKGGKRYFVSWHRVVAEAWVPNPNKLPEVHHKNGRSNKASNLEWRSKAGHRREHVKRSQGIGLVFINRNRRKWRATYYSESGKRVYLGMFLTKKEATAARKAAIDSLPDIL